MGSPIDRRQHLHIAQPIEGQCPRHGNHMPAVNQACTIRPGGGIEMDFRRILPQARGHHMLGFRQGDPINVVDHLANIIVAIEIGTSC